MPYATARTNGGGASRQARHSPAPWVPAPWLPSSASPQRAHASPLRTGNSVQQTSQIGTEESRGSGEPQRAQEAGRRAQLKASTGLRSTRATARQRVVSDGGTSIVSEPESLRKTHLAWGSAFNCAPPCDSIPVERRRFHRNRAANHRDTLHIIHSDPRMEPTRRRGRRAACA
jgi:hypothetical protein